MFAKTKKIALRLSSCLLSVGRNVLSKLIKNGFQKIMPVNWRYIEYEYTCIYPICSYNL